MTSDENFHVLIRSYTGSANGRDIAARIEIVKCFPGCDIVEPQLFDAAIAEAWRYLMQVDHGTIHVDDKDPALMKRVAEAIDTFRAVDLMKNEPDEYHEWVVDYGDDDLEAEERARAKQLEEDYDRAYGSDGPEGPPEDE
jgi:hypothetical protein